MNDLRCGKQKPHMDVLKGKKWDFHWRGSLKPQSGVGLADVAGAISEKQQNIIGRW